MKIGLCGTMSVGKTTLVNALKLLPEFKDYHFRTERSKHLMDLGIPLNMDSTLKGQLVFASERAVELMQEKIITDRTVIDVMAFCDLSDSMKDHEKFYLNASLFYLIDEYQLFYAQGIQYAKGNVTIEASIQFPLIQQIDALPKLKQSVFIGSRHIF